ncbi:MAG: dienelactone hydrolase family protein [Gemmatimonadetes bacterium]|nr:dienelactone hydrolase family protein [Gemmatimonadota bacterium]
MLLSASASAQEHPIWGELEPGPFAVGFHVAYDRDHSRPEWPERTLDGSPETRPIARHIQIARWYPAGPEGGTAVTLADYIQLRRRTFVAADWMEEGPPTATQRQEALRDWATWGIMEGIPEDAWPPLLRTVMRARLDAPPAEGRYPLVVLAQGAGGSPTDMALTGEYLASHGYVVVSVPSRSIDLAATLDYGDRRLHESHLRDIEFALDRVSTLPSVEIRDLGIIGFSRGAMAAVLLAMKNPTVDAVITFDGSGMQGPTPSPLLEGSPYYDPSRLHAPLLALHTGSFRSGYAFLDKVRYSDVYIAPVAHMHHVDFSVLAMIHTALGAKNQHVRGTPEQVRAGHAWTNRYARRFLDAHVKRDAEALAFIRSEPAAVGVPEGLIETRWRKGHRPPPSRAQLAELILRGDVAEADSLIMAARSADSSWVPFREPVLNGIGYRLIELGQLENARAVFDLNTRLYPGSANTFDSLGEAQMLLRQDAAAIRSYRRSLELNPENANARERLRRLIPR